MLFRIEAVFTVNKDENGVVSLGRVIVVVHTCGAMCSYASHSSKLQLSLLCVLRSTCDGLDAIILLYHKETGERQGGGI